MTDKKIIDTTRCAWKSFEGTYCPEVEQLLKLKEQELEQYKASKQASYEEMQKRWNELELENRTLAREILKLNSAVDFMTLTEHSAINKYNKLKQTLTEIKEEKQKQILNKRSEVIKDE